MAWARYALLTLRYRILLFLSLARCHGSNLSVAMPVVGAIKYFTNYTNRLDKRNYITKNVVMNSDYTKAIPAAWKNVSLVFSALGDEHRQRILLTFEPGERLNVGQIVEVSTLSRSAVSHHLKILREAGVLDSEKIGKEVYFWLNKKQIKESLTAVMDYMKSQ